MPPVPPAPAPEKLNCVTVPTPENSGFALIRTYRLSAETTAVIDRLVPSGSVLMIG